MTNVRRPFQLQLRSAAHQRQQQQQQQQQQQTPLQGNKQALSPTSMDSLPSQILPHLFVGAQEQTSRETLNKLNIKYILSLGLLPLVLQQQQQQQQQSSLSHPNSPVPQHSPQTPGSKVAETITNTISTPYSATGTPCNTTNSIANAGSYLLPAKNSSKDYKIRVRSNNSSGILSTTINSGCTSTSTSTSTSTCNNATISPLNLAASSQFENKGIKQVRSVHCKCINVGDRADQPLFKFFDEAHAFIEEARRKKCNILVHCLAGISRSPTIAIAYLMRVKSMHWKDAYDLVKQCRPQIDPNLSFVGQLKIYNESLQKAGPQSLLAEVSDSKTTEQQQQQQQQQSQKTTTAKIPHHHLTATSQLSPQRQNTQQQQPCLS